MTETRSYSELLINKDWKHRSFRDAVKEVSQTEAAEEAWNIVPDERRRSLFYLFRTAFLMGLSVEETLSRAFAETRSEPSYTFDFGKNVEVDESLFDAYWIIWKLARSVSSSSTELAKHVWAFDSPETLLANNGFQVDAKMKWGDAVVDEFISLASTPGSGLHCDMFAAFYRSRIKAPKLNAAVDFQTDARFSGVLGYVEMYACKKVSDVCLEYYYDMKTKRSIPREFSQEKLAPVLTIGFTGLASAKSEAADKEKLRENVKNLGLLHWIQGDDRLADMVNAELLADKGWMYRRFDDVAKSKFVELVGSNADWSLVSDAQCESLFWTFRAAFLLGYSVEESIETSVEEICSRRRRDFKFGKNVGDKWLKIFWPLWRIARASEPGFEAAAKFAWAFDSPLSLLRDEEFSRRAKGGWGDGNFELLVELASQQNENVLRDLHSSFKCARSGEVWGGSCSQETSRFRGVIDFMGGFASKKVGQTCVEYYYDMATRQTIARNSSQEESVLAAFDKRIREKEAEERAKWNKPVVQEKKDAFDIVLEILSVVGTTALMVILYPIIWFFETINETYFCEKKKTTTSAEGEVRLVDRVYLDKEHGVVAEIYMRRD